MPITSENLRGSTPVSETSSRIGGFYRVALSRFIPACTIIPAGFRGRQTSNKLRSA